MAVWDPTTYLQFADQRGRPFADLLAQVRAADPGRVVDLGCGPGQLTATLAERWPAAEVVGLDSSAEMVERARSSQDDLVRTGRLQFGVSDLREWQPDRPVDVLVSNATLQWVPGHRTLLPRLVGALRPGGWFAFQVPGNFAEPSHRLLHELAADPRFADATADVERPSAAEPGDYLADLSALGCRVEAWETTYLHVLSGPDPVFRWILRNRGPAGPAGAGRGSPGRVRARVPSAADAGLPGSALRDRAALPAGLRRGPGTGAGVRRPGAGGLLLVAGAGAMSAGWGAAVTLRGERLLLTPLRLADAADFLAGLGSPEEAAEVTEHLSFRCPDLAAARRVVAEALTTPDRVPFAQRLVGTGELVGSSSYYEMEESRRSLAIGHTWLARRLWRTGVNTESKLLMMGHAFDTLGAERLVWHTDLRNTRSQDAIARLGATREGVLRHHRRRLDGSPRDTVQFSMLAAEWPSVRQRLLAALERA